MNCDRIARAYRWLEYLGFGAELERRRFRYLSEVADAREVLALGEGDGRFLDRLARRSPQAAIEYVDSSARMMMLARARAGCERIQYRQADARTVPLPCARYDLIVTHFFLDCFNGSDARGLIERLARAATPDAKWVISEFRQARRGWRRVWSALWLRTLYSFFAVTTGLKTSRLMDHHPLLQSHGFRLAQHETSRFGLLASELWSRVP